MCRIFNEVLGLCVKDPKGLLAPGACTQGRLQWLETLLVPPVLPWGMGSTRIIPASSDGRHWADSYSLQPCRGGHLSSSTLSRWLWRPWRGECDAIFHSPAKTGVYTLHQRLIGSCIVSWLWGGPWRQISLTRAGGCASLLCAVLWFVKQDVKAGSPSEIYPALSFFARNHFHVRKHLREGECLCFIEAELT